MSALERTEWTDPRINDLAAEVIVLKGMPIRVATLSEQVIGMRRDIDGLGELIRSFDKRLDDALEVLGQEQADQRASAKRADESHKGTIRFWTAVQSAALIAAVVIAVVSLAVSTGTHP